MSLLAEDIGSGRIKVKCQQGEEESQSLGSPKGKVRAPTLHGSFSKTTIYHNTHQEKVYQNHNIFAHHTIV
jgi:hypothetical protein